MTYDCLTCGACCAIPHTAKGSFGFGLLTEEEAKSFPPSVLEYDGDLVMIGSIHTANDLRCSMLKGEPGVNAPCAIYEDRPKHCRDFEPGGALCLWARRQRGMG